MPQFLINEGVSMRMLVAMRLKWLLVLVLALCPVVSAQAQVFTLVVRSIDGVLDTIKYGMRMAGQANLAEQLDGLIEASTQGEGFKGIDTKKPFGIYLDKFPANPSNPPLVGFIPITNEQDCIDFLGKMGVTVGKDENGIRTAESSFGPQAFLRFDHGYAFIAQAKDSLASVRSPASVAKSLPLTTVMQADYQLDQIPAGLKNLALTGMDMHLAMHGKKQDNETEDEFQGRQVGIKAARGLINRVIQDAKAVRIVLSADQKQHQFTFDVTLQANAGSPLQKEFQQMTKSKTAFGNVIESPAASLVWHGTIDESVRMELNKVIDAVTKAGLSKEKNELKRAVAERVLKAIEPTLKSDSFDVAAALRGGDDQKPLTAIAAIRVKNGKQIEQIVRDLAAEAKGKEHEHVKLDADKIGDVSLHIIEGPPESEKDKDAVRIFGAIKFAVAFLDDAIFITLGERSVDEVKQVISSYKKTKASEAATLQVDVHGRAFTRFEKDANLRKAFEKALSEPGSDLIRMSLRGGDDLQFHLQVSSHYLKLAGAVKDKGE
jgi:hypothetical protein